MKKSVFYLLLLLVVACDPVDDPANPTDNDTVPQVTDTLEGFYLKNYTLFDTQSLPHFTLTVPVEEWNMLLQFYDQNPQNEEYVKCDFAAVLADSSVNISQCGLRLKGNTSRRRPEGGNGELHKTTGADWHHASFAVKFNKNVADQKFNGKERVHLKWFKDDAMYVREVYCYDLFRRFGVWTAPLSGYCKLSIQVSGDTKPAYYGVYEIIETVDAEYLKDRKDRFGGTKGNLWKANWGADFVNADVSRMGIENITLTNTYTPVYDYKSDPANVELAKLQLRDFITNLKNKTGDDFKTWITTAMDVPLFLKTYSVNVVCGMWDDYWTNKNNFYFYFNEEGKFFFIPFDYDNTLGTSQIMKDAGTQDVMNWGNNSNLLVKKIISIPEYETLYKSYLNELINANNKLFYVTASAARIQSWQNMIKNDITNDTGEDMIIQDVPASWGNCSFYRLLGNTNNFFVTKAASVPK